MAEALQSTELHRRLTAALSSSPALHQAGDHRRTETNDEIQLPNWLRRKLAVPLTPKILASRGQDSSGEDEKGADAGTGASASSLGKLGLALSNTGTRPYIYYFEKKALKHICICSVCVGGGGPIP